MKKCPYCAEMVANSAISCKFCGENLEIQQELKKEDHFSLTIKDFGKKKSLIKSIIRYGIATTLILVGWINCSSIYNISETNAILLIISGAVGLYVATLLP